MYTRYILKYDKHNSSSSGTGVDILLNYQKTQKEMIPNFKDQMNSIKEDKLDYTGFAVSESDMAYLDAYNAVSEAFDRMMADSSLLNTEAFHKVFKKLSSFDLNKIIDIRVRLGLFGREK